MSHFYSFILKCDNANVIKLLVITMKPRSIKSLFYCTFPFLPFTTLTSSLYHIHSLSTLSSSLNAHFPSSSFLFPSPRFICRGYIIFYVLLLLGQTPSPPPYHPPLSQSGVTTGRKYRGGQASHGIIQLTYPETSIRRVCVYVSVCVTNREVECVRMYLFVCVCVSLN